MSIDVTAASSSFSQHPQEPSLAKIEPRACELHHGCGASVKSQTTRLADLLMCVWNESAACYDGVTASRTRTYLSPSFQLHMNPPSTLRAWKPGLCTHAPSLTVDSQLSTGFAEQLCPHARSTGQYAPKHDSYCKRSNVLCPLLQISNLRGF